VNLIWTILFYAAEKNSLFKKGAFILRDKDFKLFNFFSKLAYSRELKLIKTFSDNPIHYFGSTHLINYIVYLQNNLSLSQHLSHSKSPIPLLKETSKY
jgi:hypothetical protein